MTELSNTAVVTEAAWGRGSHKEHVQNHQSYYDKDIFIYVYIQYYHILKKHIVNYTNK